ncbi:MAG: hypothetical protein Ct9H300mP9_2320 [Candidatus Neomarinimicrobiota bacterium]|nr:MAG: hypothetical protein Ct9H300mP9_2320 [Candidatus Neomarinimicrobiota bacterium]
MQKKVGNLLFLSGIGPRKPGMKTIPGVELDETGNIISYDIVDQCRSVFENIRNILKRFGEPLGQSCRQNPVFLTDMENDFPLYNKSICRIFW